MTVLDPDGDQFLNFPQSVTKVRKCNQKQINYFWREYHLIGGGKNTADAVASDAVAACAEAQCWLILHD